jgi:hypothetical protein
MPKPANTLTHGAFYTVKSGRFKGRTGRWVIDHYGTGSTTGAMDFIGMNWISFLDAEHTLRPATAKEELAFRRELEETGD